MKTNAVIRIIIFSVIILILLGALVAGLVWNNYRNFTASSQIWDKGETTIPESGIASNSVRDIEIQWVSGSITIQHGDVDTITYSESPVSDSKQRMIVQESGGELEIAYCNESISFPSFGISIDFSKDLLITVPRNMTLDSLEIEAASAKVYIKDLNIRNVDFDGASGTCTFENCHFTQMDIDTASGDIEFSGILDRLEIDAASASFRGTFEKAPESVKMDGMSGDLELTLPVDCGFSASIDGMSSDFATDFPVSTLNGSYVYGDGSCRIQVNAMSGDVMIRKLQ